MQTTKKVFKSVLCLVAILLLLAFLPIDRGVAFASFALQGNKETGQVKEEYQYYYQNLTGKEKEAYRYICAEIEQFPERIYIPELNKEELNRVFEAVLYDHPEYWFLDNHCNYESRGWSVFTWSAAFLPVYRCDSETYQKQKAQVEAAAKDILAKAPKGTAYEKELYVHDTLIRLCDYGTPNQEDDLATLTVYGALVTHAPVCEGYARATQYLLTRLQIPNYLVVGTATDTNSGKAEAHMWNVVTIDGKKYCLDVTWDDHTKAGQRGNAKDPSHIYFNVTAEELAKTHRAKRQEAVASCVYTEANYFKKEGLLFTRFSEEEEKVLLSAMTKALQNGEKTVELRFKSKEAMADARESLIQNRGVFRLLSGANAGVSAQKRVSADKVRYAENTNLFVLSLQFY